MIRVSKIISGGQTGADRGGLDAAIALGIPHGGFCPRSRRAEDGVIPARYELVSLADDHYRARTAENVASADATIIFARSVDTLEGGSRLTMDLAQCSSKPFAVFGVFAPDVDRSVKRWLARTLVHTQGAVLNVAGNRESVTPGIQAAVRNLLVAALEHVKIVEAPQSVGLGALGAALRKKGLVP